MRIKSVTMRNFRSFGDCPITVSLSEELTALVGGNGSGKTALLMALARMFGDTQSLRTITRSDFHHSPGMDPDHVSNVDLSIETVLTFPELDDNGDGESTIPPTFRHLMVDSPNGDPFCRLRLEAKWLDDGTSEGHVDQHLWWVLTADEQVSVDQMERVLPHERGRIQVHYVPANRDVAPEFRGAARSRISRLLRAISWDDQTRDAMREASDQIGAAIDDERAVILINRFLRQRWDSLKDDPTVAQADLAFLGYDFDQIIRGFGVVLRSDDGAPGIDISELSEGQQSLFYLAVVATIFDVERETAARASLPQPSENPDQCPANDQDATDPMPEDATGLKVDQLNTPELTIFAIEEPENHLSPHYLARIVALLRSLTSSGKVQLLFSSHSPSVLRRVFPEEIRYCRLSPGTRTTDVQQITLPDQFDEASKFVRQAVMAYPELYFGKFVILAEGPSEEMVLPRIAAGSGLQIDESFVCVVPLGGRHVNHFWKLLSDLDIPYATLLDLDAGRRGGGWGRIKYVCNQLMQLGTSATALRQFEYQGAQYEMSAGDFDLLHNRTINDLTEIHPWIFHLEKFGVYFSGPLDLDLSMLRNFPEAYQSIDGQDGPNIPADDGPERDAYIRRSISAAIGNETGTELYESLDDLREFYPWYRYLFLSRSKPVTHLQALAVLDDSELRASAPRPVNRLLAHCNEVLFPSISLEAHPD